MDFENLKQASQCAKVQVQRSDVAGTTLSEAASPWCKISGQHRKLASDATGNGLCNMHSKSIVSNGKSL